MHIVFYKASNIKSVRKGAKPSVVTTVSVPGEEALTDSSVASLLSDLPLPLVLCP